MNRKAFQTCAGLFATVLGLVAGTANAQTPPTTVNGDWPNLGAYNNRQGMNADPTTYGSGLTDLRWRTEGTLGQLLTIVLDNTSFANTTNFANGPYNPPSNGAVAAPLPDEASWPGVSNLDNAAQDPYTLAVRSSVLTLNGNTYPVDTSDRLPYYNYATCTPSAKGTDPRVPLNANGLKIWEWAFQPPVATATSTGTIQNYAVYVNMPVGGTRPQSGAARLFPQRYFVYEIIYGNNQSFVDVIDTAITGSVNVRLGGGNGNNTTVFPWDNVHPIRVRLYNTVPRNPNGSIAINGATPSSTAATETTLASQALVYADECELRPQNGTYLASPTAATWTPGTLGTIDWQVTAAQNRFVTGTVNNQLSITTNATVTSYQANPGLWTVQTTPAELWNYSLVGESAAATNVDDTAATFGGAWTTQTTGPHIGTTHHEVLASATETATATYQPTLTDGSYAIYVYLPGTTAYAQGATYRVYQGTTVVETLTVDQSARNGWVRLGGAYYEHVQDGDRLHVEVSNADGIAADQNTRLVYADAVRFVSPSTIGISSSPVHATVGIRLSPGTDPVPTKVVIVADDSGKIHCLDMRGNGDGTTTEYWSYPSTAPANAGTTWSDPNLTDTSATTGSGTASSGIDGVTNTSNTPTARMPGGFNLSTAAIARVGNQDLLYIASSTGRVYCIDMAGRGDFDRTTRTIGTTARQWTFPNDYDPTNPSGGLGSTTLGSIRGSIVFGDTAQGAAGPTVYVPARQGRIYALRAIGEGEDVLRRRTSARWAFPAVNQSTLPEILMTPTLQFGRLYFGTLRNANNDGPGQFIALNAATGAQNWFFDGISAASSDVTSYVENDVTQGRIAVGSFIAGPVAVPGTELDKNRYSTIDHPDTIYVLNNNAYLYGFNAATGAILTDGTRRYETSELNALTDGNLTYTVTTEYGYVNNVQRAYPVIVVPSDVSGNLYRLFARLEDFNIFDGLQAGFNIGLGTNMRSSAAANNTLFTANAEGVLSALDNLGSGAGNLAYPAFSGGQRGVPPNDPRGTPFRQIRIRLVNRQAYLRLRTRTASNQGDLTYDEANSGAFDRPTPTGTNKTQAFEWGETAYILVENFPFATTLSDGTAIAPPQVNITLTIEGAVSRTRGITAQQFKNGQGPQITGGANGTVTADGYAIYPFTFQGGGAMSLPPGNGVISATITTAATNTPPDTQAVEISQDPRITSAARVPFIMANPLALVVEQTVGGAQYGIATANSGGQLTGTIDPYDLANRVNGSPNVATNGDDESQLLATGGYAQHGTTVTARAYVVDRSLMALIRPEGRGIENLRVSRSNLALQGGTAGLYRLLAPGLYPNFEDLPGNEFPNNSLDYPDIGRERVSVVSNPETEPDNPVLQPINLLTPLSTKAGSVNQPLTEDNLDANNGRFPRRTPINLNIDVPRYQPPINVNALTAGTDGNEADDFLHLRHNSVHAVVPYQGYFGRVTAFVDSSGDGKLTDTAREPYRAFNLSVSVLPQVTIQTTTPNIDLGSLASGTGYSPSDPSNDPFNNPFSPWLGAWRDAYRSIGIRNEGNVNLLHLRIAKGGNDGQGTYSQAANQPWQIVSSDNDPNAWLSGANRDAAGVLGPGSLWSNIDRTFAAPYGPGQGQNEVILPKARVTDRIGTELTVDPFPRANPNTGALGQTSQRLNTGAGFTTGTPKVAISVPIGFPVGNYTTQLRVIEDAIDFNSTLVPSASFGDQVLNLFPSIQTSEAYSDAITASFKVRETRMTNSTTPRTAPVIDSNLLPTTGPTAYRNSEPAAMRDVQNGDVKVVWSSNRPGTSLTNATVNPPVASNRLYFAAMVANATKAQDPAPGFNPPLWDLSQFDKSGTSWLKTSSTNPSGYPANSAPLFAVGANDTVDENFVNYGAPSFPQAGTANPLSPTSTLSPTLMAFVGNAEVKTPTGRVTRSRVFVAPVSGRGASFAPGDPIGTLDDPLTAKGKPSIVQLPGAAFVFYPVTSAGQTGINVSRYTGAFAAPVPLDFGQGFSSVTSPSVGARVYLGANDATNGIQSGQAILDVSFSGKLRGRPNAEVYLGRMRLLGSGAATRIVDARQNSIETQGAGNGFSYLPQQVRERLVGEGNGLFRARGIGWSRDLASGIELVQTNANGAQVSVLFGTPTIDRESGLIVYNSRMGGKVYLDPELGTVRFVGGTVSVNAELRLTYVPTFLRITPGGTAGYSSVNGLFDSRFVSERDYWYQGTASGVPTNVSPQTVLRNDRYFFTYGRAAAGAGVTARPYMTSMRLGLRLPTRIATGTSGYPASVSVSGNGYPFQVDPANGRVYFQAEDEGKTVTVSYTGVNEANNQPTSETVTGTVSYVLERDETPVLVDEAVNDSAVSAFLDPFTYAGVPRPPLVWMFYVSTRAGSPDVYFQTIAPRFTPFAK